MANSALDVRDPHAAPKPSPSPSAPRVDSARPATEPRRSAALGARLFSLLMLCAVAAFFSYCGVTIYQFMRDAFVAPAILSPDSDVVLANKLKLSEFVEERARAAADIEGIDAQVVADDQGIAHLEELRGRLDKAVRWTSEVTAEKASAGSAELQTLARERQVMVSMLDEQKELTAKARNEEQAGLISQTDLAKQAQTLSQLQLALIDNERTTLQSEAALRETALEQRSLGAVGDAPLTPEMMTRVEQTIRVEVESLQLESDKRSKLAEKRALVERIARIDELESELKSRPIYRAIERNLEVAFVPYTQIDGIQAGAGTYSCLWGLLFCKQVGTVSEIVPGELVLPDPWGAPARGQYVVLDLWDHDSAKAKTLRVRRRASSTNAPGGSPAPGGSVAGQ
jgi:hypothetical protein